MDKQFINKYGEIANLLVNKMDYFVDMGGNLWNRNYKHEKTAINYLEKQGYKEVTVKSASQSLSGREGK